MSSYRVSPNDPRAPPQEVWEQLAPEGDAHYEARSRAREVLGSFFSRIGRKVYLACELPVHYPGEAMFAPDVIAVVDVEPHSRMRWMVSDEAKSVDFALDVHVTGERRKGLERNVDRFARLGIREYFVFDRGRLRLSGWRLEEGRRAYRPILPRHGTYRSEVLGLELQVEKEQLRFYKGGAALPDSQETIARLERMVEQREASRAELEQQLAEEARLRAEETQRREDAERRLAEALAELERLRGGPR